MELLELLKLTLDLEVEVESGGEDGGADSLDDAHDKVEEGLAIESDDPVERAVVVDWVEGRVVHGTDGH